jgi:hypothetical protein
MNASQDDDLRRALAGRDETVMEMVAHSFRGRARWLTVVGWVKMVFFVLAAALAAVQFFRGETTRWLVAWSSVFVVCALGTAIMFVLYWLELNRNAITRELKRLELRIIERGNDAE